MVISHHIEESYFNYLRYLREGGERIVLPSYKHDPNRGQGMVYASALGMCPLKAALDRRKVPAKFPPSEAQELSALHIMQQGVRDAEPIQEALVWANPGTEAEVSVEGHGVRGRIDVLLNLDDEKHIIEIKRRDTPGREEKPQPKISDCYQVMAYAMITNTRSLSIVALNRYFVTTWHFNGDLDGGYIVHDERGDTWNHPQNVRSFLNRVTLMAEVERQQQYLNSSVSACPMPDFLNTDGGWQCYQTISKPKPYKMQSKGLETAKKVGTILLDQPDGTYLVPGEIKPRCPHFCHPVEDNQRIWTITTEGGLKLWQS